MTAAAQHRLEGLEPDNLLAFMALLGLLRALDTARPPWRARAYWDVELHPLRPVLVLREVQTREAVAEAAAEGIESLAETHEFDRDDLNHSAGEARTLLLSAPDPQRHAVLDALMSDGAVREDGRIWPTPLCFLFGQGHQHFLSRLAEVPRGVLPKKLQKLKAPPNLRAPSYLATALYSSWAREDPTDGLRWDPAEDRRYALRARDPSGDPAGQQHGANRLAAVALPVLSCAVVARRGETRLLARASSYGADGTIRLTWPIWTRPARLPSIAALLAHPELAADGPDVAKLAPIGVQAVMRAERISVGKFFNVTAAATLVT